VRETKKTQIDSLRPVGPQSSEEEGKRELADKSAGSGGGLANHTPVPCLVHRMLDPHSRDSAGLRDWPHFTQLISEAQKG
jgi:hypothetical protein